MIGSRLKELRESKQLSQGDIEKRTGLLRCHISRVENGHTVPSVDTLEKMARFIFRSWSFRIAVSVNCKASLGTGRTDR